MKESGKVIRIRIANRIGDLFDGQGGLFQQICRFRQPDAVYIGTDILTTPLFKQMADVGRTAVKQLTQLLQMDGGGKVAAQIVEQHLIDIVFPHVTRWLRPEGSLVL